MEEIEKRASRIMEIEMTFFTKTSVAQSEEPDHYEADLSDSPLGMAPFRQTGQRVKFVDRPLFAPIHACFPPFG